ncbi:zinc ribbon domain-containing protein [Carnobacterium gallinarum]|uniref:zinc ribbon domain-containing protein n=1 Tax=Carnobacterium gallinarum TaxID=2749 RepID=UPI000554E525|nr:hypothetical protein [Carnobacterium gallinarum]
MKNCLYCGHQENQEESLFCENCGSSFVSTEQNDEFSALHVEMTGNRPEIEFNQSTEKIVDTKESKVRKPLTKKQKTVFILIGVVLLISVGIFSFGKTYYTKEKQVQRFVTALETKNTNQVTKMLVSDDRELKLDKKNVGSYIKFISKNKGYLASLESSLKNSNGLFDYQLSDIALEKKGKHLLFFDKYNFKIQPVYVELSTNRKDATIYVNQEKVAKSDKKSYSTKVGPYLPGDFIFKSEAKLKNEKLHNESKETISYTLGSVTSNVDLELTSVKFTVESNVDGAEVFVNDKKVASIKDGETEVGPIAFEKGMQLQLKKKYDWGTIKTEKEEITTYSSTYYSDFENQLSEDQAEQQLSSIYREISSRIPKSDATSEKQFIGYFSEGVENEQYKAFAEYIKTMQAEEGINRVSFDIKVASIAQTGRKEYNIVYDVAYNTSYKFSLNKPKNVESFKITADVKVDEDDYQNLKLKIVKFTSEPEKTVDNNTN